MCGLFSPTRLILLDQSTKVKSKINARNRDFVLYLAVNFCIVI